MVVYSFHPKQPDSNLLCQLVSELKNGKIVVYPTDTCYGIGGIYPSQKIEEKIARLKNRKKGKQFSVAMADLKMIKKFCYVSKYQEKILKNYLPGPYTFILATISSPQKTLGVRIVPFSWLCRLITILGSPLITTSANLSSQPPCYDIPSFLKQVKNSSAKPDIILDAGPLPPNPPSTIVDLTQQPFRVIRGHFP